ncbi:GH16 beta-1,3-glucan recognition protein, partial [Mycena maculata]
FSPPASVRSFSASFSPSELPGAGTAYPFPASGTQTPNGNGYGYGNQTPAGSTRASSLVDVPRAFSTYSIGHSQNASVSASGGSRPTTGSASRPTSSAVSGNGVGKREAFASPPSRPLTIYAAPPTAGARLRPARTKSTALLKLEKPWLAQRDPYARVAYWVTWAAVLLGVAAGAVRIWSGWQSVLLLGGNLCPVMIEDFSGATTESLFGDNGAFFREVDASGFGNGEFEMTTDSDTNSYVLNNQLYLVPTLTSNVIPQGSILNGAVYNLTGCTYNITHSSGYTSESDCLRAAPDAPFDLDAYLAACSAVSNDTLGTIIPPVMSARVSTRKSASLKFGRVEVVAKIPTGDWLWPALWMLPVGEAYGAWPLSGEIDIMCVFLSFPVLVLRELARGNAPSYPKQGVNYVRSSLNWGPAPFLNAVAKTYGWWTQRRGRYDDAFHTYALEWSEGFIRMYVDSRLTHMFQLKLAEPFWEMGAFPAVVQNGSESVVLANPWVNGTRAAPFDQPFYLIMNVAVGGTNGWFPDGPEKPWLDGSATAARDFLEAQDQWYPSWPADDYGRALVIDSVKMWESC